jgi:hypothetical protein
MTPRSAGSMSRTYRFARSTRICFGAAGAAPYSKAMMMISSPARTWCAAAPFMQITPLPAAPGIAYVSSRAPFVLSTTSTFSYSASSTRAMSAASIVTEPT